jgi:hypothetical protein
MFLISIHFLIGKSNSSSTRIRLNCFYLHFGCEYDVAIRRKPSLLLYDDQDSKIGSIAYGSEVAVCSHSAICISIHKDHNSFHIIKIQKEEIHVSSRALTRRNGSDRFSNFLLKTATYLHSDKPVGNNLSD